MPLKKKRQKTAESSQIFSELAPNVNSVIPSEQLEFDALVLEMKLDINLFFDRLGDLREIYNEATSAERTICIEHLKSLAAELALGNSNDELQQTSASDDALVAWRKVEADRKRLERKAMSPEKAEEYRREAADRMRVKRAQRKINI